MDGEKLISLFKGTNLKIWTYNDSESNGQMLGFFEKNRVNYVSLKDFLSKEKYTGSYEKRLEFVGKTLTARGFLTYDEALVKIGAK